MAGIQLADRLRIALIELMGVESTLEVTLANPGPMVERHPAARGLIARMAGGENVNNSRPMTIMGLFFEAHESDIALQLN